MMYTEGEQGDVAGAVPEEEFLQTSCSSNHKCSNTMHRFFSFLITLDSSPAKEYMGVPQVERPIKQNAERKTLPSGGAV